MPTEKELLESGYNYTCASCEHLQQAQPKTPGGKVVYCGQEGCDSLLGTKRKGCDNTGQCFRCGVVTTGRVQKDGSIGSVCKDHLDFQKFWERDGYTVSA